MGIRAAGAPRSLCLWFPWLFKNGSATDGTDLKKGGRASFESVSIRFIRGFNRS